MLELKQIHALLLTCGLAQQQSFTSQIINFSALSDSGNIDYSYQVLTQLPTPTTFDWNAVIRGYSKSRNPNRSISVFAKMLRDGFSPDYLTYPFLAKASARLLKRELGVAVHGHIVKAGFQSDRFISNSLIHMYATCRDIMYARKVFDGIPVRNSVSWNSMLDGYAKCGDVISAREVFELMPERDVVSWSSLIDGYAKAGEYGEALKVFERMRVIGPKANEVTMVSVLCACAHLGALEQGTTMHCYMVENKLPLTLVLQTALVDMYAKCGAIDEAVRVFRGGSLQQSDVLIWNAMIDLINKKAVEIRDPTGKPWPAKLVNIKWKQNNLKQLRLDMSTGWGECCRANKISVGDTIVFEFVKKTVLQLHIFRKCLGRREVVLFDAPNM